MCYTISDEFKRLVNTKEWNLIFIKVIDEIAFKVPSIRLSFKVKQH